MSFLRQLFNRGTRQTRTPVIGNPNNGTMQLGSNSREPAVLCERPDENSSDWVSLALEPGEKSRTYNAKQLAETLGFFSDMNGNGLLDGDEEVQTMRDFLSQKSRAKTYLGRRDTLIKEYLTEDAQLSLASSPIHGVTGELVRTDRQIDSWVYTKPEPKPKTFTGITHVGGNIGTF